MTVIVFTAILSPVSTVEAQVSGRAPQENIEKTAIEKPIESPSDTLGFWEKVVLRFLDLTLQAFSLFLAFAAFVLELTIQATIVNMRLLVEGDGGSYLGLQSIDVAWRTIRDVANILFVFVLLLISINIILGSWASGPYNKSLIPKVIIAALLINFSLFFTKLVIDGSNILAYEFYQTASSIRGEAKTIFGIPTTGLTTAIMQGLRVTEIVTDDGKLGTGFKTENGSYVLFSTLLGIIAVLVAAFVLLVMSVLLITRFVLFLLLMITSPIAFIGELLPQLRGHSEKWWGTLWAQATFAPVFFVLILIVVVIINDKGFSSGLAALFNAPLAGEGAGVYFAKFVAIALQYAIVIGMLIAALVAAKQTSGKVGDGLVKWGSKWAGKAAFGGTAALGSMTLGRMGRAAAESGTFNRWAAGTGVTGLIGKGLVRGGEGLGKASFDVRATAMGKELGAGDAAKGYTERRKAAAKAEGEYVKKAAVPVRNPNVQAADDKLRGIKAEYTQIHEQLEQGKIGRIYHDQQIAKVQQREAAAKQELSAARRGALAGSIGTAALRTVTPWRGVTDESRARHTLARATRKVGIGGIREVEQRRKDLEKKLKEERGKGNVKAEDVYKELKKRLKEEGRWEQEAYVSALGEFENIQKQQKDANKDFQREFAGKKQGSTIGYMRDAADKVRKDLGESPKDKVWEAMKKAVTEEAEGGEKKPDSGEPEKKPAEGEKPKTS